VISAVIPTFKGAARLARHLASVFASLEAAGKPWEVVVVDDGGGELGALPEGVRLVEMPRNEGYGPAVNAGVERASGDYLLILNDDVHLHPDTVRVLRAQFPATTLFAVVPTIRSPLAACGDEGGKAAALRGGLVEIVEVPSLAAHPTLYPVGCCYLCPRAAFLELGGYDERFAPFLWEDVDLGYRAWRRGLRILHVPEAACDHEGSATLSERRSLQERERIGFRNRVLFHLLDLTDPRLRERAWGAWAAYALFETDPDRLAGLAEALAGFQPADRRPEEGLSDAEILERVGQP
jgi:GT2 family glycosyltransferase